MKGYRIQIEVYGGPIGYCSSEYFYSKVYENIDLAKSMISHFNKEINKDSYERRRKAKIYSLDEKVFIETNIRL